MPRPKPAPLGAILPRLLVFRLAFPTLAVALGLIAGTLYLYSKLIQQEQLRLSHSVAQRVTNHILYSHSALNSIAAVISEDELHIAAQYLDAVFETSEKFHSLSIIAPDGKILASAPFDERHVGLEALDLTYDPGAIEDGVCRLSDPFISPATGSPTVYLTCRAFNPYVVVGEIDLEVLQGVIKDEPTIEKKEVFITDSDGLLLAHPNSELVRQQAHVQFTAGPLSVQSDTGKVAIQEWQFVTREDILLPGARWIVFTQIPLLDAFGPYLAAIAITFLVFIGYWMLAGIQIRRQATRLLSDPIQKLSENLRELAKQGYPTQPIAVDHKSAFLEIIDLCDNYREMARAIKNRQTTILENEQRYRSLIEHSSEAICLEVGGKIEIVNHKFCEAFDVPRQAELWSGKRMQDFVLPTDQAAFKAQRSRLLGEKLFNLQFEFSTSGKEGADIYWQASCSVFPYQGKTALQTILLDTTKIKRASQAEKEQRALSDALRDTAEALNSTLNFDEVMVRILNNAGKVVPHDSSNIMLIAEDGNTARIVASKGYHELGLREYPKTVALSIDETATLSQMYRTVKPLVIPDTETAPNWINLDETAWIRSYVAAPIKVQERVIGFLNLNSPTPNFYTAEMADRLQAFADQAGTALQNARLLGEVQESNRELIKAYEATLVGMSKALELRDYETEGHSQRVVELSLKLAVRMGVEEPQLTYLRYGALLHDIGKLGISDAILLKPGPLNDVEWEIMRRHPAYARQIIESIPYLHPAMDIPYYHHEQWDGSGYLEGLKNDQIPLAARIFSVVDVWDGLLSTRPYHAAWQVEAVVEYLKQQAGRQFDPDVVEEFLKLI